MLFDCWNKDSVHNNLKRGSQRTKWAKWVMQFYQIHFMIHVISIQIMTEILMISRTEFALYKGKTWVLIAR